MVCAPAVRIPDVGHEELQKTFRVPERGNQAHARLQVAKGIRGTGGDNCGGPVVTKSGLLFIGATNNELRRGIPRLRYHKLTGKLLWETVLPATGNATPSVYEIGGREYVVIVCGGGKNDAPSDSSIVAFALLEKR
jgi:quinoprotein glucose dehydrogenase